MANTVVTKKLSEGQKRAVFLVTLEGDGSGEFVNEVIIDPRVHFELPFPATEQLTITKLWYGSVVFDFVLKFNALVPEIAWACVADADNHISFEYFGGLADQSGPEGDGKLLISTNGFASAGSVGTLVIEVKKD